MSYEHALYSWGRQRVGMPCSVPVEPAGQAGRLAGRGEGIHAVDQQCRRPVHPRLRGLPLIGHLTAVNHRVRVAGQRGREPLLKQSAVRAGWDRQQGQLHHPVPHSVPIHKLDLPLHWKVKAQGADGWVSQR